MFNIKIALDLNIDKKLLRKLFLKLNSKQELIILQKENT